MPLDRSPSDAYDTPDSTPDPYASSSSTSTSTSSTNNYGLPSHIDLSSLPSGLPILGPLTGYTPAVRASQVRDHLASISQTVQRPLTRPEQEAIVYHSAKAVATASWGPAIGIAAGAYRTYATRAEFRWPFYGKLISGAPAEGETQKGFWDGQKMRAGGKEIFQAVSTRAKANALHVSRGSAYCLISVSFFPLLVGSYAMTVSAVGELRDPRLKEVNRAMREMAMREMRQKKEKAGEIAQQPDARRIPSDRDQMSGTRASVAEVDDASPTGGAGMMMDMSMDDEQERLGGAGDMGGVLSDGQMSTAEARARPPPAQRPTGTRAATYQLDKVERQPKDFGSDFADDDDDASPTGGSGAMDGGDGDGGGSVWERIRQQSASDPSSSSGSSSTGRAGAREAIEQREGSSTTGDNNNNSFTFSSSEDGERSHAQREFDERVEKERRGGDFSSDGGGRRW